MGRYNILVTAISGDVANSILKCLRKSEIVNNLYGCDIYQYPCGINKVKRFFRVVPCCEEKQYLEQLEAICREQEINVIIPANEYEIVCLNKNRDIFTKMGVKLLLHQPALYDIFFNKQVTQQMLKELVLPYISSCYADEYAGGMRFPLVIKDVFSCGSKAVRLLQDENDIEHLPEKTHNQLIQECMGSVDEEYTVPLISLDGGKTVRFIPFRRTLSKAGYTNFLELAKKEYWHAIEQMCRKIACHVKLYGAIDLQMRYAEGKFYIFECNPRLSGTVHFRHQLGFHDAVWWVRSICGEIVDVDFKFPERKFVGIRELNEEIYWEQN